MRFYNDAVQDYNRLKNVLISDKQFNPEQVKIILKSDFIKLLNNYAEFNPEDVNISIEIDDYGEYNLNISVNIPRLKIFGHL